MRARERERLVAAAKILKEAEKPLRVLRALDWPATVRVRFFDRRARELPKVRYERPDVAPVKEGLAAARRLVRGRSPGHDWLNRQIDVLARSARMLAAIGTRGFFRHSAAIYGVPTGPLVDGRATSLQLARRLDRILRPLTSDSLGSEPEPLSARELAKEIQRRVDSYFGKAAPRVVVVRQLSAKASAGAKRIRIRADARFTKEDVEQLVMHEAMVHVATTLNGRAQRKLPILAVRHAGTTRTQEGLAVFSELISGALGPARLRRLARRVLALQRAIEGADFLDLYKFFLRRTDDPEQSFEDARRIVRGGLVTGGAPFTKDGVYLDGLLRVNNFLRAIVELRRLDLLPLLFCGKLDIEDIPALSLLQREGLVKAPRFLPPWAEDRRFVVSQLAYSGFLNRIDLKRVRTYYADLLAGCEPI